MIDGVFVPVAGFLDYLVSFEGDILKVLPDGNFSFVKPSDNSGGYKIVKVKKGKKWFTKRVHILTWTSFIGKIPYGYQVNHILGNKELNGVMDLDLMTQKQNLQHSRELGLRQKPKFETKLDDCKILTIHTLKEFHTRKSLVAYSGTTIRNIEMILAGQTWKGIFHIIK